MITTEQKQKLIAALKNHTLDSNINTLLPKLPILFTRDYDTPISAKEYANVIFEDEDGVMDYSGISTLNEDFILSLTQPDEVEYLKKIVYEYEKMYRIYYQKKFHYNNKWYSYKFSADEPQFTFGILKVDFSLPYRSFEGKRNKKSFISSLNSLIYQGYCEPFMVFINNKFVNWNCIDVVFDCDDTYLILYGEEYNWYNLSKSDVCIEVLPFKVEYIGTEPQDHFDMMYEVTKSYIQDSLRINSDGKITITIPGINEIYEYRGMVYNVGAWLYTQLKYEYLGLLSQNRVNKLKKFDILKYEYNIAGNIINTLTTKFNALDKDSYDRALYDKICYMTKEMYQSKVLFRFDDNGLLSDTGSNIIALIDETMEFSKYIYSDENIFHIETSTPNVILKNNYVLFKNNYFCPDYNAKFLYNMINIDNPNKDEYRIYILHNKQSEHVITHIDQFNDYFKSTEIASYINSSDEYKKRYANNSINYLDYQYKNNLMYDDNVDNGLNRIISYNTSLLNPLYHTNIESTVISGKQANDSMVIPLDYENRNGLKIPRNKYENHESYVLVFEDGELLREYWNMVVYPNFFFIPMDRKFNNASQIELLYFNNVDNNEIEFNVTQNMINNMPNKDSEWKSTTIFNQFIRPEDLKIFSRYPKEIMVYKDLVNESPNIAFNISYRDDDNKLYLIRSIIDNALNKTDESNTFIAVSSRKFIYQRLRVDQKAYRIVLDKRFRYCDNQKQYVLFINGRRMNDESFLVTIPKHTRPFWGMYLYVAKFVNPEDRIELFYLPDELVDSNINHSLNLEQSGYIEADKNTLEVPYDPRLYLLFINGKKIPSTNITPIDSHTFRINKDTLSTNNLMINKIYTDIIPEVKDYLQRPNMISSYDRLIKYIKDADSLGLNEIDKLFNIFVKMSNTEVNKTKQNVAKIAIINEIVRDFWVTSGYPYNELPFIYDFEMDEYILNDYNGNAVLPALDATQIINIIKDEVHLLYFYHTPEEELYEIGSTINGMDFFWEYSQNLYSKLKISNQSMSYKLTLSEDEPITEEIDNTIRQWNYPNNISQDTTFTFTSNTFNQIIQRTTNIRFVNGLYYGNVDEYDIDFYNAQYNWYDTIMALEPKNGIIPTLEEQENEDGEYATQVYRNHNNVIEDFGYVIIDSIYDDENITLNNINITNFIDTLGVPTNDPTINLDNYFDNSNLQHIFGLLNKSLQTSPELVLDDYIIGNNNYFIYACPKKLAYEKDKCLIEFLMPDPHSEDIIANCRDDKATPIYTSGKWETDEHKLLEPLEVMEMIYLGDYVYTNSNGYKESYSVWRSNGYFTRLFDNYKFHIEVRYKDGGRIEDSELLYASTEV